jgi:hypothetical protein
MPQEIIDAPLAVTNSVEAGENRIQKVEDVLGYSPFITESTIKTSESVLGMHNEPITKTPDFSRPSDPNTQLPDSQENSSIDANYTNLTTYYTEPDRKGTYDETSGEDDR